VQDGVARGGWKGELGSPVAQRELGLDVPGSEQAGKQQQWGEQTIPHGKPGVVFNAV
jgi:hypothetical protein